MFGRATTRLGCLCVSALRTSVSTTIRTSGSVPVRILSIRCLSSTANPTEDSRKSLKDFQTCKEYLSYRLQGRTELSKEEWSDILFNITDTLPIMSVRDAIQFVEGFEELTDRKKSETATKLGSMVSKSLTKYSRDLFVFGRCRELKNLSLAFSFREFLSFEGHTTTESQTLQILKMIADHPEMSPELDNKSFRFCYSIGDMLKSKTFVHASKVKWNLVGALSNTSKWRDALRYVNPKSLGNQEVSQKPMTLLIQRSMKEQDFKLMWKLMQSPDFHLNGSSLRETIPLSLDTISLDWLNYCDSLATKEECWRSLEDLFKCWQELQYFIREPVQEALQELSVRKGLSYHLTTINPNTCACENCKSKLGKTEIESKKLVQLAETVRNKLIEQDNLYYASSPRELEKAICLLNKHDNYNIVIDGLNISLGGLPEGSRFEWQKTNLILNALDMCKKAGMEAMLVTRRHAAAGKTFKRLVPKRTAGIIVVDNSSEDDPFILYSALRKGTGVFLLTNDLLRQHHFKLPTPEDKRLLDAWQSSYQVKHELISEGQGSYILKLIWPPKFDLKASKSDDRKSTWHLPIAVPVERDVCSEMVPPKHWLCLSPNKDEML